MSATENKSAGETPPPKAAPEKALPYATALRDLFGSRAAEAVLLHLYHYGESYGRAISSDFAISLDSVQRQLDKLENAGVLVSKRQGRTLLFSWNPKSGLTEAVKGLVAVVYERIPLEKRPAIFPIRRRPRRKDKPQ
jgi:DNA-binding transcriptional ArsR family regulator